METIPNGAVADVGLVNGVELVDAVVVDVADSDEAVVSAPSRANGQALTHCALVYYWL